MVSAVLALAAAVNRLAEAHESVANSIIDFKPPRMSPGDCDRPPPSPSTSLTSSDPLAFNVGVDLGGHGQPR